MPPSASCTARMRRARACAPRRVEEVTEARTGMTARLKAAEAEKDALEEKATVAKLYLNKQGELYSLKANSLYALHLAAKVRLLYARPRPNSQ